MMEWHRALLAGFLALVLAACSAPRQSPPDEVAALAATLVAMDPAVDPEEARRAAEIALTTSSQLARDYGVTTAALVHNSKVNAGLKERGLCYHYAEDMQARLDREGFDTMVILRAIAEPRNPLFIDHSTAVIAPAGGDIYDGVVLDAWRHAGDLFWAPTRADTRYDWEPRMQVLRRKQDRKAKEHSPIG